MLVFQDAFPLICGVTVNRQWFVEEVDDDDNVELLTNDDDDDDGVGCCILDDELPDEL